MEHSVYNKRSRIGKRNYIHNLENLTTAVHLMDNLEQSRTYTTGSAEIIN